MAGASVASSHRDDQDTPARGESKTSKRRCVQSACVPCRKRKSKCDGGTPVCATCTAVYKTPCFYDAESESRRSKPGPAPDANAGTKRHASATVSSTTDLDSSAKFILISLQRGPEEHLAELISLIRKDPATDIAIIAESWRKTVTLPPITHSETRSLENDLSVLVGRPAITINGQSRHFGHSAGLGLVPEDENFGSGQSRINTVHLERQGTTWTDVTKDVRFVENLLALYFTWSHPFYVLFSRECFYKDFRGGRDKYCSSLLVNAICAYACHFTDDPAGRTDPSNFRTAGDHFFAEAKRLLFEDESPSLTTTQALCIMSMREPSTGRDTSGFNYIGRCIRMCVELGLHLNNSASPALRLTPSEIEVRKVTFWGCFTVDTVWSIVTGRISQLPRAAITLHKPILDEVALPEAYPGAPRMQAPIVTTHMLLQEFTSLSELINDNNYMFFAPKERLTSTKLLDCYHRYQDWYKNLNPALGLSGQKQPEPHTLVLHMLYHTIIVHLFRPMLKVDLIHSDVRPRDICVEAANKVSELVRTYRKFYDFRVAHLAIPHILLSVCIVHLLYSKDNKTSYKNLVDGLQGLEDLHECHYFGARSFRILHTLATTWNLPWPEELHDSKLMPRSSLENSHGATSPPDEPLLIVPNTVPTTGLRVGQNLSEWPTTNANRRESLSMFSNQSLQLATHPAIARPGSVSVSQHPSPAVAHPPPHSYNPYAQYTQSISVPPNVSAPVTSPNAETAETLFWNPIPGMPGPILPRNTYPQISPMGLDTMLQAPDMGDRLVRDGFKMSEEWQTSGFTQSSSAAYSAQHTQPQSQGYRYEGGVGYGQQHGGHGHGHPQEEYDPGWYQGQMS
ncbi:hypothetical protein HBI25_055140 [Parastagonospora nodorum]|nr:hypothetical protein HBI06_173270 [Parastagonospora nodorum]KAH4232775.1 hypothetical protein HBI05_170240 [Parastagonospora nodorum]KAH5204756.1 hypothetical protein HBH68_101020 [Parastagonospora nodorum]KAH5521300.1 hypothetical protein HBI29_051120 [Parastagonospora nodorum]KAH5568212.1 hypothetical protein HBI25_055140 [Parastagonospora nodorum]